MKRFLIAAVAGSTLAFSAATSAQQKVRINLANAFPNSLTLIGEAPGKFLCLAFPEIILWLPRKAGLLE